MDYAGVTNLELLISDVDKLVSLPDVYYRLEALIQQPDSTMDDFARVMQTEPDICARLLSLANSAFYSFPASIESIEKAVQIIGIRQIRELVLATSIVNLFNNLPLESVNMRKFWEHSVAVGVLAKSIGQYCHLTHPERFYVSGLLHDIGRLVFYLKLPGMMHDLLQQGKQNKEYLYILEKNDLGYTHAECGGELLKKWRVPESIYEPVLYHHNISGADEYSTVSAAVHVADVWVNKHQIGSSGERLTPAVDQAALALLNLQDYELDEIWVLAEDDMKSVFKQFLHQ